MKSLMVNLKKIRRYYYAKKTSWFVKKFYKENKDKKISYLKNIWSRNFYWDFFIQSLPHSIKSKFYVPYDYYVYKIEPNLNDTNTSIYADDKNMYDKIFGNMGVKMPKTVFRSMNNILLDGNYNSIKDINYFIKNINKDIIIKQANGSYGGKGIEKFIISKKDLINLKNNEIININELQKKFNGNFVAQEVVKQHDEMSKYHPFSLNTLRVHSYRSVKTNKVSILMGAFRTGANKSFIDNGSSGGIMIGLKIDDFNNATLRKYGIDQWGNYCTSHPESNIKFEENKIPNFSFVVECIEKLANLVPYQRLIGWDFSIDEQGLPVFIELNIGSGIWAMQSVNGRPFFGDFTLEIKEYLDQKKNLK